MRVKLILLILAAMSALMLSVTFLRAKKTEHAPAATSKQEKLKVRVSELPVSEEDEVTEETAEASNETVSSEAKAEWIEKALASDDPEMNAKGNELLRETVSHGTAGDVLAALPKATFFSEETAQAIAALQSTLCRFQNESDDLAFEMIKLKFNLVFKRQAEIKPWSTICRAG